MFQPITSQGPPPPADSLGVPQSQPAFLSPDPASSPPSSYEAPNPIQPITNLGKPTKKKSKKPLILAVIVVGVLLLVTTIVVVIASSSQNNTQNNQQQTEAPQGPQPAQAIDIEQANNSITQDITSHDNNKDFPEDQLSDKNLGL